MQEHHSFKIKWIGFPENRIRKLPGVYLIEGIYVGASTHIRGRIIQHLNNSKARRHSNRKLQEKLIEKIKSNEQIEVELLSENPFDEKKFIDKLSPCANIECRGTTYDMIYSPNQQIK